MTPFQLEDSAKAPWTRTIVGLPGLVVVMVMCVPPVLGRTSDCIVGRPGAGVFRQMTAGSASSLHGPASAHPLLKAIAAQLPSMSPTSRHGSPSPMCDHFSSSAVSLPRGGRVAVADDGG